MCGLCHGFSGVYKIAEALNLDRDKLHFQIPGVNHFVWLTHLYHDGEDVFPMLDRWIETEAEAFWKQSEPSHMLGPVAIDLYKRFGVFPIGDTCNPGGGSWPYWYHVDAATEKRWQEDPYLWYENYFDWLHRTVTQIREAGADETYARVVGFPAKDVRRGDGPDHRVHRV